MFRCHPAIACATIWLLQAAAPAVAQDPPSPEVAVAEAPEPAPVEVWDRIIVVLRAQYAGLSPAERARKAAARILALADGREVEITASELEMDGRSAVLIGTKTDMLFGLGPEDIEPGSGQSLEEFSQRTVKQLEAVLQAHAEQMRWPVLLWGLGFTGAATLAYLVVVWLLLRLQGFVLRRLDRVIAELRRAPVVAGISLGPILLAIGRSAAKLVSLAAVLVATYLWLTFCFNQFFYTQPWAEQLLVFFLDTFKGFALGILGAMPGLFTVGLIFWLTRVVAGGVSRFFVSVEEGTVSVSWLDADIARATRALVLVGIWLFALTVAYPYIPGSGTDAFKGVSVFAGLILSLGSSGFVNHIMSGLVIAYTRALRRGEYVTVGEVEGTVEDLGPLSTKLVTLKRERITVPNGVVVSAGITNYTRLTAECGAWVATGVTIGYDAPWRQVHALLLHSAEGIPKVRKSPRPFVLQRALSDFYVEYELRFAIDRPEDRLLVLSDVHAAIQDAFNEAGVQIMSPNFEAQPEKPVLVTRDQWYAPPAEREPAERPHPRVDGTGSTARE